MLDEEIRRMFDMKDKQIKNIAESMQIDYQILKKRLDKFHQEITLLMNRVTELEDWSRGK